MSWFGLKGPIQRGRSSSIIKDPEVGLVGQSKVHEDNVVGLYVTGLDIL